MPIYVYGCKECGEKFEYVHPVNQDPPKVCRKCEGELVRIIQPVAITFKGSGFHKNDYR
jgi:putative FmdB family regulatory protein